MREPMIRLVLLDDDYIEFLYNIDNRVMFNKNHRRPYIGVLFEVSGHKYYAPLSSPKEKFKKMRNNVDFMRIAGGELGAICLNNMIPVIPDAVRPIDVKKTKNKQYQMLLINQMEYFYDNAVRIVSKAENLYHLHSKRHLPPHIYKRCVNFKKIEQSVKLYKPR